ncbi:oxaloacetate decarboxylase subunit gamma [Aliidiomarina halalkaliphila]|uniref:Oxaloacetate decarboxylase subunit gamma n=1 Tax=Aliidiomarina halalkaliphila TaxID=2593535 RepID=A0A552X512_9GAMM|nr:OadG family transporter subunit [Aliidiomarina halalkaliphila]TRW50056.1 oxaloacetate decarboxylase subunit gamma [Aliidiomarina halalkaliphila]
MADLFMQALELMLAGMGVVFLFLCVLTGAVMLLTRLCPEPMKMTAPSNPPPEDHANSQASKLAAVTVAVQKYRHARGRADQSED